MGLLRTNDALRFMRTALLPLLFVFSGCLAGSAQEQEPSVLGPQESEDGDREHRPGQPCLLCHGPDHFPFAPGEEVFLVAGTVYSFVDDDAEDGLSDVDVKIIDANQREVTVTSKSDADYVLIEIPIPAGCSYDNRDESRGPFAVHREYQRDRVAIFCDRLPAGTYTYKVALAPRFSGTYTLNPARAEMQYLPVVNGLSLIHI